MRIQNVDVFISIRNITLFQPYTINHLGTNGNFRIEKLKDYLTPKEIVVPDFGTLDS